MRAGKYGYRFERRNSHVSLFVGCGVLIVCVLFLQQLYQYFFRSSDASAISFSIEENEQFAHVAQRLADAEVIPSAFWFRVSARIAGVDSDRGVAATVPGDRSADILGSLLYPSGEAEVSITIPEGYTLVQIGEVIRAQIPSISLEDWERVTGVSSPFAQDPFIIASQKPSHVNYEGYLFPDTYRFFSYATAEDVVWRMIRTMESRVNALGNPTNNAEGFTLHELLTLASIVEREVRSAEDMGNVADIFFKRLHVGMALQSDATVNYVTGGNDPSISFTDRDKDFPYNTYQYTGLPPGAISNPGMNALRAVWQPTENAFFYFLTDSQGNVYYAETHNEHVQNKALYL